MSYPDYLLESHDTQWLGPIIELIKVNQEEINKLTEENIKLKCENKELRESLLRGCEQRIELLNMIVDEQ